MTIDELMNEIRPDDGIMILTTDDSDSLGRVACGTVIEIGERSYIVLEHRDDGTTAVITKEFWKRTKFDNDSGDYAESAVRNDLNTEFYNEVAAAVGAEGIIEHEIDLTADDGTGKGITCADNVSVLTTEEYRRYREFLPAYGSWWWLATPVSKESDYARGVCFVYGDGTLCWGGCYFSFGVRPFLTLDSSISDFSVAES